MAMNNYTTVKGLDNVINENGTSRQFGASTVDKSNKTVKSTGKQDKTKNKNKNKTTVAETKTVEVKQGISEASFRGNGKVVTNGDEWLINNAMVDDNTITQMRSLMSNSLTGIEGVPYQFMATVDRRLNLNQDPTDNAGIGRKYGEKIFSRFPLLFVTPCTAEFMKGFTKDEKATVTQALLNGGIENLEELLNQDGKYYSVEFAYAEYYRYLNCMLNALAIYLGIGDVKVKIGGRPVSLATADWSREANSDFKTYFSAQENLVFYVDGFSSVSQSFTNDTSDSSLASTINGFADQVNEIKFLFGTGDGAAKSVAGMATEVTTSITSGLSAALGSLGGGIVESLANNGVNTILNGGKIIFPEIWSNSGMDDGSASFDFKFRSPDNDTLSIYLNVLKPYCKWLCLAMPHQSKNVNNKYDPHSYTAPFLVKSSLKGKFSCDTGIVAGLSVTKGAECQWNDDGLPTQIDISVDIKNLYKNMAIATLDQPTWSIVNNTAYMDFIANMAGLNILQMDMGRKFNYYFYLTKTKFTSIPSHIMSQGSQAISRLMGALYDFSS